MPRASHKSYFYKCYTSQFYIFNIYCEILWNHFSLLSLSWTNSEQTRAPSTILPGNSAYEQFFEGSENSASKERSGNG